MAETTIPTPPCFEVDELLSFYGALGFEVTYKQTRPYLYLALRYSGFELHFGDAPKALDPRDEMSGGCLVMVNEVEPYHRTFTAALRRYGAEASVPDLSRALLDRLELAEALGKVERAEACRADLEKLPRLRLSVCASSGVRSKVGHA